MAAIDASRLLRPGLLDGVGLLLAGAPPSADQDGGGFGEAVHATCAALGARVAWCAPIPNGPGEEQEAASDEAVSSALRETGGVDMLVVDAAATFAAGAGAPQLDACLNAAWTVTRAVFNLAFQPRGQGGRILYLAPPEDAGVYSDPARAGLENLSRTLSIEWSRHGVTAVTVAPGVTTTGGEVATLAAFLASPAGAYFSGCLLDLRGARQAR
jgi:citronellol/citronellal dehydrogenase